MAIKTKNGKVLLKNGKASCVCCEDGICTDSQSYSENHGWGECPNAAGPPCFPAGTPSCANLTISGQLVSREFYNSCKDGKTPKADVSASFDDFGFIGSLSCDKTSECNSCGVNGTITPTIVNVGTNKFKLTIPFKATNAYWGGPYGINCSATFYFV